MLVVSSRQTRNPRQGSDWEIQKSGKVGPSFNADKNGNCKSKFFFVNTASIMPSLPIDLIRRAKRDKTSQHRVDLSLDWLWGGTSSLLLASKTFSSVAMKIFEENSYKNENSHSPQCTQQHKDLPTECRKWFELANGRNSHTWGDIRSEMYCEILSAQHNLERGDVINVFNKGLIRAKTRNMSSASWEPISLSRNSLANLSFMVSNCISYSSCTTRRSKGTNFVSLVMASLSELKETTEKFESTHENQWSFSSRGSRQGDMFLWIQQLLKGLWCKLSCANILRCKSKSNSIADQTANRFGGGAPILGKTCLGLSLQRFGNRAPAASINSTACAWLVKIKGRLSSE